MATANSTDAIQRQIREPRNIINCFPLQLTFSGDPVVTSQCTQSKVLESFRFVFLWSLSVVNEAVDLLPNEQISWAAVLVKLFGRYLYYAYMGISDPPIFPFHSDPQVDELNPSGEMYLQLHKPMSSFWWLCSYRLKHSDPSDAKTRKLGFFQSTKMITTSLIPKR